MLLLSSLVKQLCFEHHSCARVDSSVCMQKLAGGKVPTRPLQKSVGTNVFHSVLGKSSAVAMVACTGFSIYSHTVCAPKTNSQFEHDI